MHDVLEEGRARTRGGRPLNHINEFMGSTHLIPGGNLARENLLNLLLGQIGHPDIGVHDHSKDYDGHLMVYQISIPGRVLHLGKHIGIPDLDHALFHIGQPSETSTPIDGDGSAGIGSDKFIPRPAHQGS